MLQFQSKVAQSKDLIRKLCKLIRHKLYCDNETAKISHKITENILNSEIFKNSKNIMLFYPLKEEINLLALLENKDKNFYFPKCDGENLLVCPNCDKFEQNKYKIYEPVSKPVDDPSILDIIFVPALCADMSFYRLGYGCGYYDKFLSNPKIKAKKIIPIAKDLLCKDLPLDEFDIKCDYIVCETGFIN